MDPKHQFRHPDGVLDEARWIGVREDRTREGKAVNTIVAIDLDQAVISSGRVLVWLAWDHPNMPWKGTTFHLADIDANGGPAGTCVIAGGVTESVFQPE